MNASHDENEPISQGTARVLTPEAQRALAEAEARRKGEAQSAPARQKELGGRDGPEPIRFGDWENKGIATDF